MTKPHFRQHADGTMTVRVDDGFTNMISGIGMADLKAAGNTYLPTFMSQELENAYRTSTWFGKIVDIPADDSTREWRTWQVDDADITLIEAEEKRLDVLGKVRQARTWARLYGGAVIVMGGLPGYTEQEVRPDAIRKGALKFLTVLPRQEISPGPVVKNPLSPLYGQPLYYQLQGTGVQQYIHPSRVVPFLGPKVASTASDQEFWGDPIWFRLEAAIKSADSSSAIIDSLLHEAKIDVLRVSNMTVNMASKEYEAIMIRRFQMVALLKGMQNVMLLDKDDEWQQKIMNWTGLPDVQKQILNVMSGASDIPMFRLTGQNLTGLSNTGDGEQRAYNDAVKADQKLDLGPAMRPLDEVLVRSALGYYPDDAWYEWNSLYQMTNKEKAEIDKLEAEAASTYAASGLVPSGALAKAVQARMIGSGRWGALEEALEEETDENKDQRLIAEVTELLNRAKPTADPNAAPGRPAANQSTRPALRAVGDARFEDATPRTLYVRRDVKNWQALADHFKAQGFETTLGAEMHVTIVYSKQPVDWMKIGGSWSSEMVIPEGGPRLMEAFGDDGSAKVLLFSAPELEWRHNDAKAAGASYDHGDYQAHITISWAPDQSLDGIEPYKGEIVLGPEIFEELNPDWKAGITEDGAPDDE